MKGIIFFFLFCKFDMLLAQSQNIFTSSVLDPFTHHSSYAGLEGNSVISLMYRDQWAKIPGRPMNQLLQWNSPWRQYSSGFGLALTHESIGIQQSISFRPSFNRIFITDQVLLSTGASVIYQWTQYEFDQIRTPEGIYSNAIDHKDNLIEQSKPNESSYGYGLSIFAQSKWVNGGLSYQQLFGNSQSLGATTSHFAILSLSKEFKLSRFLRIEPVISIYSNFFQHQIDLFSKLNYNGKIFGGVGIRGIQGNNLDAIKMNLGYEIFPKIILFGCLERRISPIGENIFGASQEFGLKYNFSGIGEKSKLKGIEYNPRWTD